MRISDVTPVTVAEYARLPELDTVADSYTEMELRGIMAAARQYIEGYTGIKQYPESPEDPALDDYEDLTMAYLILCQDLYDNRSTQQDNAAVNRTLDTILGMHGRNLVCG